MNRNSFFRVLALMLVMIFMSVTAFAQIDLAPIRNSDILTIDVNKEDDLAFVESTLGAGARAFSHENENEDYFSSTKFDIIILDYFEDPYPLFRLWFNYSSVDFIYATSVSFDINGKRYTFTGVGDPERCEELGDNGEKGIMETLLIKFGKDNLDFLLEIDELKKDLGTELADYEAIQIPVTIHGIKDVTTTVSSGFIIDFIAVENAMIDCGGTATLFEETDGTPMTVEDIE